MIYSCLQDFNPHNGVAQAYICIVLNLTFISLVQDIVVCRSLVLLRLSPLIFEKKVSIFSVKFCPFALIYLCQYALVSLLVLSLSHTHCI